MVRNFGGARTRRKNTRVLCPASETKSGATNAVPQLSTKTQRRVLRLERRVRRLARVLHGVTGELSREASDRASVSARRAAQTCIHEASVKSMRDGHAMEVARIDEAHGVLGVSTSWLPAATPSAVAPALEMVVCPTSAGIEALPKNNQSLPLGFEAATKDVGTKDVGRNVGGTLLMHKAVPTRPPGRPIRRQRRHTFSSFSSAFGLAI